MESGYYSLESLAKLKGMTVEALRQAYVVVEGKDVDGRPFYNVKPNPTHHT